MDDKQTCKTSRIGRRIGTFGIAGALVVVLGAPALADEVEDAANACLEAARLITEDSDLDGALEEANWCLTGLKQLNEKRTLSLLPEEVEGFIGGEIENQSVMGMSVIERTYTNNDKSLNMTITTSSGEGGGLGALAQLGGLFGAAAGGTGKKVRVQKRTVVVQEEGSGGNLNVTLKSGGMMVIESSSMSSEELLAFLKKFPLAEFDDAMKK